MGLYHYPAELLKIKLISTLRFHVKEVEEVVCWLRIYSKRTDESLESSESAIRSVLLKKVFLSMYDHCSPLKQ